MGAFGWLRRRALLDKGLSQTALMYTQSERKVETAKRARPQIKLPILPAAV
jgi:hypothetical protein